MKPYRFLYEWKQTHRAFVRPKFKWYFGPWWKESNLPVWRKGNIIHFGKYSERKDNYNFSKLETSEWTEEGKKNHPILSKLVKPSYEIGNNNIYIKDKITSGDIILISDDLKVEYYKEILKTLNYKDLKVYKLSYLISEKRD